MRSIPGRLGITLSVLFAAVWAISGGVHARQRQAGLHLTPHGYEVPVYGMSLVRGADGHAGTRCARLTDDQIESRYRALTVTRSELASFRRATVRARPNSMTFAVIYADPEGQGFNDPAFPSRKVALEASLAAWSAVLQGTVPVVVEAHMQVQDATTLASAGATDYVAVNGRIVPFSLAAQLTGSSANGGTSDIQATFNSTVAWDYALSGVAARDTTSFVFTAMHEICHGLGFADTFDPATGALSNSLPTPYDVFVNRGGPSANLLTSRTADDVRADLVSNDLFFAGPSSMQSSMVSVRPLPMVKLYAPNPYEKGSSVSHLDQQTYQSTDVGVMTPQDFPPGTNTIDGLTKSMMADLGYQVVR